LTESLLQTEAIADRVVKNNTTTGVSTYSISGLHNENEEAVWQTLSPYRIKKKKTVSKYKAYKQFGDTNNTFSMMYFEGYSE